MASTPRVPPVSARRCSPGPWILHLWRCLLLPRCPPGVRRSRQPRVPRSPPHLILLLRHRRLVQARRKSVDALAESTHVSEQERAVHRFNCEQLERNRFKPPEGHRTANGSHRVGSEGKSWRWASACGKGHDNALRFRK
jgi:hypothetical protein